MNPDQIQEAEIVQPNLALQKADPAEPKAEVAAMTPAQARIDSVSDVLAKARANASMLKLTPEEIKLLKADFPDEAFKFGAGGDPNLIYIEHAFLRDRFDEALGMCQWALIRSRPHWAEEYTTGKGGKAVRIYADCALVIRGCLVSEAIGEMSYFPNSAQANYGDAAEGSETAAFRRCAKKIGVGLQAWKKDFGESWKRRQAEGQHRREFAGTKTNPQRPAQPESTRSDSGLQSPERQPVQFNETKFRKDAEAWLEAERVKWVTANTNVKAWAWAVVEGMILHTEKLDAVTWSKLWQEFYSDDKDNLLNHSMNDSVGVMVDDISQGRLSETAAKRKLNTILIDCQQRYAKAIQDTGIGPDEQRGFEAVYGQPGVGAATNEGPEQPPPSKSEVPTKCPKCAHTATKTSQDYELVSWCQHCGWQWGAGGKPFEAHDWATIICPIPPKGTAKKDYDQNPLTLGQIMRTDNKRFYGLVMNNQEAKGWTDRSGNQRPPSKADEAFAQACREAVAHLDSKKAGAVDAMRDGIDQEQGEPPF